MNTLDEIFALVDNFKGSNEKYLIDVIEPISRQLGHKIKIIKKGIDQRCLTRDNKVMLVSTMYVSNGQEVKFQGQLIDLSIPKPETKFDKFITLLLHKYFNSPDFDTLTLDQKDKFNAFVIEYFSKWGYEIDELSHSSNNLQVLSALEEFYKRYFSNMNKGKNLKKKELVDSLISYRELEYESFGKLISNIVDQYYNLNSNDVFQDFSRLFARKTFTYLINPLLSNNLELIKILERIIKSYKSILAPISANEKIEMRSIAFKEFSNIDELLSSVITYKISVGFKKAIEYFKVKCDEAIGFQDTGEASILITPDNRTYNFENTPIFVHAYIENIGTGIAKNIKVIPKDDTDTFFISQDLGEILTPKERRLVKFKVNNLSQSHYNIESLKIQFRLQWNNDFDKKSESSIIDFEIRQQKNVSSPITRPFKS